MKKLFLFFGGFVAGILATIAAALLIYVTHKPSEKEYIPTLQQAGAYEKSDTTGLPHFYYETPENGRMKDVRRYFKLDSIAGNGDEISKILNIMYWIHDNIRHDGSNWALAEFCSIDLYHYHKATGKGINCRHLAIALNEMYLSMGWKSRYVTCLPKDETDQDCHVINCVWVDSLQKWIWLDPTFAAYVKDENGNFLSISEVRERLIDGRPLVLNEDANWNNQNKQTKEYYLENYMAKNLYWIQVPVNSMFNPESRYRNNVNTYVSLLPIGYTRSDMENMGTITHDSEYFWQKP
jgi:transglutaminase-like putative cysteine protease